MRSLPVKALDSAETDVRLIADWYRNAAGPDIADRFEDAFERTALVIADNAEFGTLIGSSNAALSQLRKRTILGFAQYLVFFQIIGETVEIVRVFHSSQDWWGTFEVG